MIIYTVEVVEGQAVVDPKAWHSSDSTMPARSSSSSSDGGAEGAGSLANGRTMVYSMESMGALAEERSSPVLEAPPGACADRRC